MKKNISLKVVSAKDVKMFRIANRKGYAAICKDNLTEGQTPYQAYLRMNKALKRMKCTLKDLTAAQIQKIVKK